MCAVFRPHLAFNQSESIRLVQVGSTWNHVI